MYDHHCIEVQNFAQVHRDLQLLWTGKEIWKAYSISSSDCLFHISCIATTKCNVIKYSNTPKAVKLLKPPTKHDLKMLLKSNVKRCDELSENIDLNDDAGLSVFSSIAWSICAKFILAQQRTRQSTKIVVKVREHFSFWYWFLIIKIDFVTCTCSSGSGWMWTWFEIVKVLKQQDLQHYICCRMGPRTIMVPL